MNDSDQRVAGRDVLGRLVVRHHLRSLADVAALPPPAEHFVVLLAGDLSAAAEVTLRGVASSILDRGAVYVMAWGPGAERLESVCDELVFERERNREEPSIMTTAHPDDSLRTAIHFATKFAVPDERYDETCRAVEIIALGDEGLKAAADAALDECTTAESPVS